MDIRKREFMKFDVYCDESKHDLLSLEAAARDGYFLIGSIWLPMRSRLNTKHAIKSIRAKHNFRGEIKWNKVSESKLPFYKELIDCFFESSDISFRCIAVDSKKIDLNAFHESDHELGFYKFYYQLLHNWVKPSNEYNIFVDYKSMKDKDRLPTLKRVLNNANPLSNILNIQSVHSRESDLIQLCDLLLGLTQSRINKSNQGSQSKLEILKYAETRLGKVIGQTASTENKFNVFVIQLSGARNGQ